MVYDVDVSGIMCVGNFLKSVLCIYCVFVNVDYGYDYFLLLLYRY